jgi:hypothetical protein
MHITLHTMYTAIICIRDFGLCICVSLHYDKNMLIQSLYFDSCGRSVTPILEISVSVTLRIVLWGVGAESELWLVSSGIQVSIAQMSSRHTERQL